MVINTNIEAQATANNLNASQLQLAKSLSRLSSGSKIIVPSDDAAGLAVSSRLNSQIKRLDSALNNVVNAVSFTQTQDGFMKTIDKAYRRMGELAMLAQDTTKSDADRALYNQEFAQLKSYVGETAKQDFNGVSLFGGKTLDVTVDADGTTFTMVGINLADPTYTSSTNTGTDAWKLTSDAYMLSKDGYKAKTDVYKTVVDLWRDVDGNWATTSNGGVKITAGSYVSEDVTAVDTAATKIAKDNYVSGTTIAAGYKVDYDTNQLTKTAHGMSSGDAITLQSNAPVGTDTTTTYYVKKVDADTMTLHASAADAVAGTGSINLSRTGALKAPLTGVSSTAGVTAVAQQDTLTITAGDDDSDILSVTVDGVTVTPIANTASVSQEGTVTFTAGPITVGGGAMYWVEIDGSSGGAGPTRFHVTEGAEISNGDSAADIMTALVAKINTGVPVDEGVTASIDAGKIKLKADVAGVGFTMTAASSDDGVGPFTYTAVKANKDGNALTATQVAASINGDATLTARSITAAVDPANSNKVVITSGTAGTALTGSTTVAGTSNGGSVAPGSSTAATTRANVAAVDSTFSKDAHGYETGDKVIFNGTPPTGATPGTNYYVEKINANSFALYTSATSAHAGTVANKLNVSVAETNLSVESNMLKGNLNVTAEEVTMTGHGLKNGATVMLTTTVGTPKTQANVAITAGTSAYVKYLTADTFELYEIPAVAGVFDASRKIKFDAGADISDSSFRIAVDDSSNRIAINDKSNVLKGGMFITNNPITTGQDIDAVLAKSGEVVSIDKATQDISAFANELGENYDNVNLKSVEAAQTALILVKSAITQVATDRAKLGAVQSRLNFTNEQLTVTKENLSAAISRIADVDVAEEATNYARYQILVASGTEMLKQANQLPQSALQLLR